MTKKGKVHIFTFQTV